MFLLFPLAAAALGFSLLVAGALGRSRVVSGCGVVIIGLIAAAVIHTVFFKPDIEWNPSIPSDAEVLGTWTDHTETLSLQADGTFIYRSPTQTFSGTWTRADWNLYLQSSPPLSKMRFVQLKEGYRLMTHPPADPDNWDWNPGLQLVGK